MGNYSVVVEKVQGKGTALLERFKSHKTLFDKKVLRGVLELFDEVEVDGDEAVIRATAQFDGIHLECDQLRLSDEYIEACIAGLPSSLRTAIDVVTHNVREVNETLMPSTWSKEIRTGTVIG